MILNDEDPNVLNTVISWIYTKQYLIPESKTDPATRKEPTRVATTPKPLFPSPPATNHEDDCVEKAKMRLFIYLFADRFDLGALIAEAASTKTGWQGVRRYVVSSPPIRQDSERRSVAAHCRQMYGGSAGRGTGFFHGRAQAYGMDLSFPTCKSSRAWAWIRQHFRRSRVLCFG
jgi:hypothetical protein